MRFEFGFRTRFRLERFKRTGFTEAAFKFGDKGLGNIPFLCGSHFSQAATDVGMMGIAFMGGLLS